MKNISRKLLATLLVVAMLCSVFPVMAMGAQQIEAASEEISKKSEAIIEADIWSKIDRFEDENIIATRDDLISVEDYAELSDEIEALVKQSETYVEGTISRNGDFFTWETSEGIVCGYSPDLRFKTRSLSEVGYNDVEVKSYGTKAAPSDKDVYLIAPYYGYDSSFTDQYKNEANSIAKATGGQYTLYQGTNATINNIATAMQNGGVVLFDSHGITDYSNGDDYVSRANTSYLCLKTSTGITSSDMAAVSGTYGTYYHAFNGGSAYCVDGTAIKNHMSKAAPGTILWMAICLGMATNGLCTPMRNAGVEVVYGYSQSVSFTGDYKYETYFWNKMKSGSDVKTAISYMKSASGCNWDPVYSSYSQSQAKANYVAFPIVVSDQDTYPGQGKVDAVQSVYSTYKLIDNSGSGSGGNTQPTTPPATDPDEGGTVETYTYNLVTSASSLTAGEYIIVAAANGAYAGDYSYYALTTTQDSTYSTMQSNGLGFTSVPSAVTCDTGSIPYFAFTLSGNANGFTLKSGNGSLEGGGDSDGVYLYYGNATTWTATYNSSSKGFQLKNGSYAMALRDDLSTMGANGLPMFAASTASGTTVMHMYKRENAGTCAHTNTSTSTTPATCTTPGSTVVTCNACGTVVNTTSIPATGHNISYTSNNDGTHGLYCSNCNGTGTAECTYNSNVCIYCGYTNSSSGTDTNSDRYELVTSASDLTAGQYLIMASATGTYAGDYGYYILTTTEDSGYKAMQSVGLNFDSMPSALLLDTSATSKYVWTVQGNANGFTAKAEGGYLTAMSGSTSLTMETASATWKGTYSSSKYGFTLASNSRYIALRDDIETLGENNMCLFTTVASSSNAYVHLYKKVGDTAPCTHEDTTVNTTPATCTAAGESVEICDDCGEVVNTTTIPATGHTSKTTTTPATCTTAGKTVETCTTCGVTIKTTTIPATGHTSKTTTTAATCTTAGKTVETCTTCGVTIKTTTIPATGHTSKTTTTAATCTTAGKTVETCTTCGVTIKTTTIPATGHTSKTTTTAATCTTAGKIEETCTTCGAVLKTTAIAALGHDPIYADNNDRTHEVSCSRCDYKATEDCDLTDNVCVYCGYEVQVESMNVDIKHSLNLASDISVNYAVAASALADFDSFYLECKVPTYEGNKQTGTTAVILEPVLTGNYYYFTMDGLTAVQINDMLEGTLHAFKDDTEYASAPDLYSVATYAYNQLNKSSTANELKVLCAELLRYGAKAQIFKNYRTDALADDAMTPAQSKLMGDLISVKFGKNNTVLNDLANPTVTWAGKSLSLDAKVSLRMIADLSNYAGDVEDLTVRVTYTDMDGNEVTTTVTDGALYNAERNYYAFDFADLRIAELRTVLSVAVYEGNVQVSPTLEYSMDSYGSGRTGNLLTLCRALVSYADAARNYFLK